MEWCLGKILIPWLTKWGKEGKLMRKDEENLEKKR